MSKKILVTKEWHKKALRALMLQNREDSGDYEMEQLLFKIFTQFLEDKMSEEEQETFADYVEEYMNLIEEK